MFNVDGGYLSFKMAFGNFDSWQYKHGHDVSIFAVDSRSKRRDLTNDYKLNRNVGKEDIIETVHQLRRQIESEQLLPLCQIDGLEADDVVACWNLFNTSEKIVGVDKDFFQLPNVEYVYYHNLKPYSFMQTVGKLPQYAQPIASRNFALYQMLFGDVADGIQRLLPKGKEGKEYLELILKSFETNQLAWLLDQMFGDKIILNAKLVLFPYYEYCQADDWFDCWCLGHYYSKGRWSKLYQQIQDCKIQNKLTKPSDLWEF